jgi:hypothetical protein
VPFKAGEMTSLLASMFHALGCLHATIAMFLRLRRCSCSREAGLLGTMAS